MSRRLLAAAGSVALAAGLATVPTAQADSASFPPTIDAIVHGDITGYQWMLDAVNAPQAWTAATGSGVVVADIDTGADASHPDLEGQVVPGAWVQKVAKKLVLVPATVEETSMDTYGHGSHVAGIIVADDDGNGMTGIAPDAAVMPVNLDSVRIRSQLGFMRMVEDGIDYATTNGADVINMSLGFQSSGVGPSPKTDKYLAQLAAVCDAVDNATAAGVVVVASAGNSGDWGNPEHVPAACPSTLTVSALAPSFDRTYWSSFDAAVDLTAPGLDIISVDSTFADNSPTPHLSESGTSMAAPVVAGVAALIRSAHPGWTVDQVIDKLRTSAQDLDVPGRDPNTGYGLVDAAAALNVATPLAQPSDYFVTWAERVYKGGDGEYTVGWTTPARHAVTGYVVTVHGADGSTTDYPVDGQTVRTVVTMGQEDGWTVTAQTTAGDVTTYPLLSDGRVDGRGERPEKFRKLRLDRQHRHIVISWAKPKDPESIDRVQAHVQLVGGKHIHGRLRVDHTKPFSRSMRVKVPKSAAWYDIAVRLSVINTDDSGNPIGYGSQRVHRLSPAPHGTRVNHVLGAGKHAAEVTGLVTHENAKRVCGNNSCAGQLAKLVIDRGKQIQRVPVRFTQNGVFHATVWTPPGADTLRLRIIGPKRLDSGPFRRVAIDRGKRSDDCQPVAPSAPARGC